MWYLVSLFLVVNTSAIKCLKRLVFEMTCYVSSGTLNPTHSLFTNYNTLIFAKSDYARLKWLNTSQSASVLHTHSSRW